jgi:hypothetical protein
MISCSDVESIGRWGRVNVWNSPIPPSVSMNAINCTFSWMSLNVFFPVVTCRLAAFDIRITCSKLVVFPPEKIEKDKFGMNLRLPRVICASLPKLH